MIGNIVKNYLRILLEEKILLGFTKSKNINYKVEHPIFPDGKDGKAQISYIDQFPEPKNMSREFFKNFLIA